jgi:hypothetical protein
MAISEAQVKAIHLHPELIPDTAVVNIWAGIEVAPPILSLRRFSPLFIQLKDIAVARNANVELRILADNLRIATTAGTLTGNPNLALGGIASDAFDVLSRESLYFNLFNSSAIPIAAFPVYYGLWVYMPTIAHKIKMGVKLTDEESRINKDLDIQSTVEKGLLPLPLRSQIEREYQVINEVTYGRTLTVPAAPGVTVDTLHPRIDEFIVLTKIATTPGAAGSVFLTIDRDDDNGYVAAIPTFPLSLDFSLPCFIPALKEIRISLLAVVGAPVAGFNIRYTVQTCKMNNILRARWGLLTKDELPGDVWEKCIAGVL